jgi:hypothetical protein
MIDMARELKNIIFLVFISVFITIYYFDVQGLPQPEEKNLVIFLIWGIGILIVIEMIRSIIKGVKNKSNDDNSFFQDVSEWIKSRQAILVFSIVLYIILIPYIGFFVTSILFTVILNILLKSRKVWELTILPIVLLLFIYVLFVVLLGIHLPTGLFI